MMAQQYNILEMVRGVNGFGRPFPNIIYTARLAGVTDTSLTVPGNGVTGLPAAGGATSANKYLAIISYEGANSAANQHVFVALGSAANAPAGAGFAADDSIINPSALYVKAGDVLHFFAITADTDVSVEFWPLNE